MKCFAHSASLILSTTLFYKILFVTPCRQAMSFEELFKHGNSGALHAEPIVSNS